MTPFAMLERLAGLSHREAGDFHGVRIDTVKSWSVGRTVCPPGALAELRGLIAKQETDAHVAIGIIERHEQLLERHEQTKIDIRPPLDDAEARALGWPCVGAWAAMVARVLARVDPRDTLIFVEKPQTEEVRALTSEEQQALHQALRRSARLIHKAKRSPREGSSNG